MFSKAIGMEINERKYTLTTHLLSVEENQELSRVFPFNKVDIDEDLKYLGFCLKANDYHK